MAIPFLNNINLSGNEIQNVKLHNTSSAPVAAAAENQGQLYFNTTASTGVDGAGKKVYISTDVGTANTYAYEALAFESWVTSNFLSSTTTFVDGSGTTNYIPKWTPDGDTLGDSQIFDNGTYVGINNATPNTTLDIDGTLRATDNAFFASGNTSGYITIGGSSTTTAQLNLTTSSAASEVSIVNASNTLRLRVDSTDTKSIFLNNSGHVAFKAYGGGTITGTAAYNLSIDSSGNIIETTAVPGNVVETLTAASGTYISLTDAASATGDVDLGTFDLSAVDGTADGTTRFLSKDNTWDVPFYTTITTTDGTYINLTPNSATSGAVTITADISAIDGVAAVGERYLTKNNTWAEVATIPGTYDWDIAGDSGTETVASGDIITFAGGTNVTTSYSTTTNTLTINSTDQYTGTVTSVDSGAGLTGGAITASGTISVDYDTSSNIVTDAYNSAGTDIEADDKILYGDSDDGNIVNYGLVSDLPFTNNSGTVTSVDAGNTTFISGSGGPITTSGTLSYSLNATGTPSSSTYLRGDNTWAALPADPTITLTGEVTGSGTTSISTTVANDVLDVANFNATAIVTEAEGIENNDNDTTLPTSAAVKDYVDSAVVGGLVYQGGYNASTNTPDLDGPPSPNNIKKGWTYTVTADGSFFTEQVRVGDVLIAESDAPTTLADWTTVQNNIDLASLTQVGIGNVNASTAVEYDGLRVDYSSGTATVGLDIASIPQVTSTPSGAGDAYFPFVDDGSGEQKTITLENLIAEINTETSFAATITATGTVTHNLGTKDVIVQLYDTNSDETVYADVDRTNINQVSVTFASTPANSIRVLIQKIG